MNDNEIITLNCILLLHAQGEMKGREGFFIEWITKNTTLQGPPYVRKRSILLIASQLIEGAKKI